MAKQVMFNNSQSQDARERIRNGIRILAEAVKITLGPSGRVVMYERDHGDPAITKDGVTVAKQIELEDPVENMAAAMVRQAATKTAITAGDGTTTATIYAQAIYEAGIKGISSGANPQEVRRGIEYATQEVIKKIKEMARPVVDLNQVKQVAICSSNQDVAIGTMIAEAMEKVGRDGIITIEEGQSLNTVIELVDGLQFARGYLSPQFVTDTETMLARYEDPQRPYLLVTDQKIGDLRLTLRIMEMVVKELRNEPLVIIADDFSDDALSALILNRIKGQLNIVAVKAPGFGDRKRQSCEDIAIATGATLISKDGVDFNAMKVSHLGRCKKIKIDRDTTTIIDGAGDPAKVQARIDQLKSQMEATPGDFDRERVQERLARLTGSVAQIFVGGATEVEVRERRDRIEDALHACKAAIEEGILPGGGVAALHAIKSIDFVSPNEDFRIGVDIIRKALEAPLRQIAINTGQDDGVVVSKVVEATDIAFGFDASKKAYGNMVAFGIIVPAKVERVALQNAASVSGLLLTTDCTISRMRGEKAEQAMPQFPSLA